MTTPLTSPFELGDSVRPHYPWHPWRHHKIIVSNCRFATGIEWLIDVKIHADASFDATFLASDLQLVS
ncbi:MAG: hypothetical protein F6K19_46595 [Cyanothece sp. SIO1E1]|nr:hypothetical protein [Cyanothece sp. SIO1E1]